MYSRDPYWRLSRFLAPNIIQDDSCYADLGTAGRAFVVRNSSSQFLHMGFGATSCSSTPQEYKLGAR